MKKLEKRKVGLKPKSDDKQELPLIPLTIFLAKESIAEPQFIDLEEKPRKKEIEIYGEKIGTLYYKDSL